MRGGIRVVAGWRSLEMGRYQPDIAHRGRNQEEGVETLTEGAVSSSLRGIRTPAVPVFERRRERRRKERKRKTEWKEVNGYKVCLSALRAEMGWVWGVVFVLKPGYIYIVTSFKWLKATVGRFIRLNIDCITSYMSFCEPQTTWCESYQNATSNILTSYMKYASTHSVLHTHARLWFIHILIGVTWLIWSMLPGVRYVCWCSSGTLSWNALCRRMWRPKSRVHHPKAFNMLTDVSPKTYLSKYATHARVQKKKEALTEFATASCHILVLAASVLAKCITFRLADIMKLS